MSAVELVLKTCDLTRVYYFTCLQQEVVAGNYSRYSQIITTANLSPSVVLILCPAEKMFPLKTSIVNVIARLKSMIL